MYVLLGEIQKTRFWRRRLSSFFKLTFIYEHWLVITREDLAAVGFVSNKFMSSCVICAVIAREIFLLQLDYLEITKVHNKFKNNNKNGNFTFTVDGWCLFCSQRMSFSQNLLQLWSSDKIAKRTATCEFFLIRLYFCCLLDQDLKGQY